jgi:heterodisulfide reductase subunit B
MQLNFYPGCTIKTSAKNYETSARSALQHLGSELVEMDDWNCCGVVHSLTTDDLYHQIAPVRVLAHAEKEHTKDIVTLCDMCYNTLSQANVLMKDHPDQCNTLNRYMEPDDDKYDGTVTVSHLLQILRDSIGFAAIKRRVVTPLRGLRVFPYYGCMLLRPGEVSIDNPEDPTILADLMRALGAEVADDPAKIECCGSYHTASSSNRPLVFDRVGKIVQRAKAKGADAFVLSCPLCRFNLDTRQLEHPEIEEPLPVFYFTQLMCVAFGIEESALGLEDHRVDPRPLLRAIGYHTLEKVTY